MKTILFAAIAAAATLAPLQAAGVKTQTFVVTSVNILTINGKIPPKMPVFKKQDIVKLQITPKKVTGPQKIEISSSSKSVSADTYYDNNGVGNTDQATVRKDTSTQKVIGVELNFNRPVTPSGGGMVTYILAPKK